MISTSTSIDSGRLRMSVKVGVAALGWSCFGASDHAP
jgi:hypothetical protein